MTNYNATKERHIKGAPARQLTLPSDLDLKMEDLARYARTRAPIFRWVQEIGHLLQLNIVKRRKPGHPKEN